MKNSFLDDLDENSTSDNDLKERIKREATMISRFIAARATCYTVLVSLFAIMGFVAFKGLRVGSIFYATLLYVFLYFIFGVYFDKSVKNTPRFVYESKKNAVRYSVTSLYTYTCCILAAIPLYGLLQFAFIKKQMFNYVGNPMCNFLPAGAAALCLVVYLFCRLCIREYTQPQ